MDANRDKAIDLAVSQIERQFGKGAIMKLGEGGIVKDVPVVSTGSLGLDIALGIGGVPRGRVIEIYGPEASGKTTLALQIVAEAQKQGGMGAYIDAEHALDLGYAKKLGVKTDDLLVYQPDHGEQALEIEGEMGDAHMGLQARLMSQALRKLTGTISRSQTVVIFINQIRMKIGVMFGNPETTTGGKALKFYASVRMDIRRIGALKEGDQVVGNRTRVKVVKNKLAAPFRETEFDVAYGQGISRAGEIIDLGVEAGLLEKSGAWIGYGGERLGNGREAARQHLLERQDLLKEIRGKLLALAGIGAATN